MFGLQEILLLVAFGTTAFSGPLPRYGNGTESNAPPSLHGVSTTPYSAAGWPSTTEKIATNDSTLSTTSSSSSVYPITSSVDPAGAAQARVASTPTFFSYSLVTSSGTTTPMSLASSIGGLTSAGTTTLTLYTTVPSGIEPTSAKSGQLSSKSSSDVASGDSATTTSYATLLASGDASTAPQSTATGTGSSAPPAVYGNYTLTYLTSTDSVTGAVTLLPTQTSVSAATSSLSAISMIYFGRLAIDHKYRGDIDREYTGDTIIDATSSAAQTYPAYPYPTPSSSSPPSGSYNTGPSSPNAAPLLPTQLPTSRPSPPPSHQTPPTDAHPSPPHGPPLGGLPDVVPQFSYLPSSAHGPFAPAAAETSTPLAGITIVPVNPTNGPVTVTVTTTQTNAGMTTTVAGSTVTVTG
ncbi:hypothetical protein LTR91_016683 [Friedmanniomyces endolithicus]|uniref:REJ domain-containing protein n=1 Tax=Friedmanniomyces endolithicus TaxID=329885 RepID=A0AAN6K7G8_9PEZI|nr:hypothetical protein LTR57_017383 [Friedmanniomyces endolithicus]KAK0968549.1 hypothetical protein LTR91_016683 [Friedmanniomyces endolithicus]KAK0998097.1 hypothetical protein LTS01_005763 [Friedmanniomyces endolithicus]KAK1043358.1 hypothetical protein LTS16_008180 [Friedmanniomyces endolithicus]